MVIGDNVPFDPAYLIALKLPTILWGGNHFASRLPDSPTWLVWDKKCGGGSCDFADCEIAWSNLGHPARMFNHLWNGMMKASEHGEKRLHPTQKPIAVMKWCLGLLPKAKIIFEPYSGSGTTLIACENLQRRCFACEISPEHVAVTLQRFQDATGKKPTLLK